MIRTFYNDHTFQWISSGNTASGGLLETEYYQFEEQADYTAVYIEPDTTENPLEIGAFVNDTCIGAARLGNPIHSLNSGPIPTVQIPATLCLKNITD
ncbi:MAG: hypothetical protein U5Q03_09380 [Bacteroidota bacterium]|nr:hypothetical protein [Bacteroidota bacterium]